MAQFKNPQRVRMEEVAKIAGVSVATVSRALRSPDAVSAKLRERVQSAAKMLGYASNRIAGSLAGARTPLIGVIVPSLTNAFFAATLERMTILLEAEGYQLMIGQHNYDFEREERIVEAFAGWNPSALVLTGRDHSRGTMALLAALSGPVVEMWDFGERPFDIGVGLSHRAVGHLAARHFAETGIKNAAFIGAILEKDSRACARAEGFREMFQEITGVSPSIISAESQNLSAGGKALKRLLSQQSMPEGIAFSGDMLAVGAMFEVERIGGYNIPESLSILGYGDLDISPYTNPPLSTIRPPSHGIADETVKQILHRLDNPESSHVNISLDFELIRRGTT